MSEKFYNIWYRPDGRWTNSFRQDPFHPEKLSWKDAWDKYQNYSKFWGDPSEFVIRELLPNNTAGAECQSGPLPDGKKAGVSSTATVVNDYTCPFCGNNRCSKSEKACWRCGNALSK